MTHTGSSVTEALSQCQIYRVLAYVTAYIDLESLESCIESIQSQTHAVEKIVVVDNSPQPLTVNINREKETASQTTASQIAEPSESCLIIWFYPENIGIAGGLNRAIAQATLESYDFIWMFDQDSQPAPNCLAELIHAYSQLTARYRVGIVAPVAIDSKTGQTINPVNFVNDRFEVSELPMSTLPYQCSSPITSGSLLSLESLDAVPPPDTRLFIDGIDSEYGLRLTQAGYHNFIIRQAVMQHRFGYPNEIKLLGITKRRQVYSALRYYYICRNHTYLELNYSKGFYKLTCALRRLKFLGAQIFWLLVTKPEHALEKMQACLQGTYYGFRGNLDRQFSDGR